MNTPKTIVRNVARVATLVLVLAAASVQARAQRTVRGQSLVSAAFMQTVSPPGATSVQGGEVLYGRYLPNSYWQAGAQYMPATGDGGIGCFTFAGGMMWRLAESRSRVFSLYLGGNALFGADFGDISKAVTDIVAEESSDSITSAPGDGDDEGVKTAFVYGIEPRVEVELYLFRKAALVLGVQIPIKMLTQQNNLSLRLSAGIRTCF